MNPDFELDRILDAGGGRQEDRVLTPIGEVLIARAEPSDLETVFAILTEAVEWLASRGIKMWGPGRFQRHLLAEDIDRGEVYLALLGTQAVGALTLQWSDVTIWGDGPDEAGYVHALAIRRAFAGHRLGHHLLAWAGENVAATGRPYLRLDCQAHNPALCAYYEAAGFERRGETRGAARYERRVGPQGSDERVPREHRAGR